VAEHNDLGKLGENLATDFLKAHGYTILQNNWRFGSDEIDILAKKENFLIVVEVKTRKSDFFGSPETAVNRTKQKFLIREANAYILKENLDMEVRFDIISIVTRKAEPVIEHIEDAFYPTL
jgi:putative endonuclease